MRVFRALASRCETEGYAVAVAKMGDLNEVAHFVFLRRNLCL